MENTSNNDFFLYSKEKSPKLTFICLERSAARIKACRLSNRKSTCCWAMRTIKRKRSENFVLCNTQMPLVTHFIRVGKQVPTTLTQTHTVNKPLGPSFGAEAPPGA